MDLASLAARCTGLSNARSVDTLSAAPRHVRKHRARPRGGNFVLEWLVDGVLHQVALVQTALKANRAWAETPVRGMLCFVDADWPLIGGSFTTHGVDVLWQKKALT